jgi:signal transduction histidine kinase
MKYTFSNKIRIIIIILFVITLVQGLLITKILHSNASLEIIKGNISNTIVISIFLSFTISILLFFYLPVFLKKSLKPIHNKLKEIGKGSYNIDVNSDNSKNEMDSEFYAIVESIAEMLNVILVFDNLKKNKIIEQTNRIKAILNLANEGFFIVSKKGEIAYVNDPVKTVYPIFEEDSNFVEKSFQPDIENNLKKYVLKILDKQTKSEDFSYFVANLKRHITLSSAIIKDENGKFNGVVIKMSNIEKKKIDKNKESEVKI